MVRVLLVALSLLIKIVCVMMSSTSKCSLQFCNNKDENKLLWVTEGDREVPSYFFGTIHVPYDQVWPVSSQVSDAFAAAQHVYFELDLTDSYTITSLSECQLLPDGQILNNVLPKSLFIRLRKYLHSSREMISDSSGSFRRRSIKSVRHSNSLRRRFFNSLTKDWRRKRPIWIILMLNSLTEADINRPDKAVLDLFLARLALNQGKNVGALELVDEQCRPLNSMQSHKVLDALNRTLDHLEKGLVNSADSTKNELLCRYNCGLMDSLALLDVDVTNVLLPLNEKKTKGDSVLVDNYFRDALIYKRNERMAQRIALLLKKNPNSKFLFALGTGHFLGNSSIFHYLNDFGIRTRRVSSNDQIQLSSDETANAAWHSRDAADRVLHLASSPKRALRHKGPLGNILSSFNDQRSDSGYSDSNDVKHQPLYPKGRVQIEYSDVSNLWIRVNPQPQGNEADYSDSERENQLGNLRTESQRSSTNMLSVSRIDLLFYIISVSTVSVQQFLNSNYQ